VIFQLILIVVYPVSFRNTSYKLYAAHLLYVNVVNWLLRHWSTVVCWS